MVISLDLSSSSIHLSVIIPVFNRERMIERAIRSVADQLGAEDQIIIVDDGSSDGTKAVVSSLLKNDKRIILKDNCRSKGAPGARNTGLDISTCEWVAFLDSDNEWRRGFSHALRESISTKSQCDVFTCHSQILDQAELSDKPVASGVFEWSPSGNIIRELLAGGTYVDTSSAVIRRAKLVSIEGWDESCPSFQEWDLHIRLSEICTYHCVPKILVNYYQHQNQLSKDDVRTIEGLHYNLKKHKAKWKQHSIIDSWLNKCYDLDDRIDSLANPKLSLSVRVASLEPRILKRRFRKKLSVLKQQYLKTFHST